MWKQRELFSARFLFASLLWDSIGVGYFVYGKNPQALLPMLGELGVISVFYFVGSVLLMSLISIALMVAVYFLAKRLA